MTVDRSHAPAAACRRWRAFAVQPGADRAGAEPLSDVLEDPHHDPRLVGVDLPQPEDRLATLVELRNLPVPIGHAARIHALERAPALATPDVVGGVAALLLVDQPGD